MKKLMLLAALFIFTHSPAQNRLFSNEDFVNAVSKLVVDSNFSHYYLLDNAAPCSFKKFDYDEWYKYALTKDVPVYILNELAKNSFSDAAPRGWQQEKLQHAFCISEEKAKTILSPVISHHIKSNSSAAGENKTIFYFSRPVFTNDYAFAIIDMGFRCDNRQCGMGATFLFKQVDGKWLPAGKKLAWGN